VGAGASGISQRSTTTKISEHAAASASFSNTSPKKENATSAQSASFVALPSVFLPKKSLENSENDYMIYLSIIIMDIILVIVV
jgi:hypothetical protein